MALAPVKPRCWIALALGVTLASAVGSLPLEARASGLALPQQDEVDLFVAALRALMNDSLEGELRVDPRPLRNDPALVTIAAFDAVPDLIRPGLGASPLAEVSSEGLSARLSVLQRVGLDSADALDRPKCPGGLRISTPDVVEQKRKACPKLPVRIAILSLHRLGGAYWPNNVDERAKYPGRDVRTVRVILLHLSAEGSLQLTRDFVFERLNGEFSLLEIRRLLMLE